ncbi:MAG: hypothetical protein WBW93_05995 [Steroidobacteraceae bacterium]
MQASIGMISVWSARQNGQINSDLITGTLEGAVAVIRKQPAD